MPKRYEVLERSFINGRLYEPGETLVLEIDSPGGNLKQLGADKAASAPAAGKASDGAPEFSAKHNGGGRFIIVGKSGDRAGEFTGTKDEAEVEAARLNAGGEIAPAAGKASDGAPEFSAKHNGGGRFIIVGKSGDRAGEFTGTKDEAEAEAARLNAGGEIAPAAGKASDDQDDTGGNGLPDA
jgi:uncharacterized protein YciI